MFSTITKILAAATVASAAATTASIIHDKKQLDSISDIAPIGEINDVAPATTDAADQILNNAEV